MIVTRVLFQDKMQSRREFCIPDLGAKKGIRLFGLTRWIVDSLQWVDSLLFCSFLSLLRQELNSKLESLGKVESARLLTLATQLAQEKLPALEVEDIGKYKQRLQEWEQEQASLEEREREMREQAKQEQEARETPQASA